jgi:hypothetical protein
MEEKPEDDLIPTFEVASFDYSPAINCRDS